MQATTGQNVEKALEILNANGLVAIPTETVYGLAGNALDEQAILAIYKTKNRPKFDPLIAHTDSLEKVEPFVKHVPDKAFMLAEHFWPGPLTILLDKTDHVPDLLTSGLSRMAVRIPDHSLTRTLLKQLTFPVAAPSANPFGYVSPTEAIHVFQQLGDKIEYILDGGSCVVGVESTIIGFQGEDIVVYRLGGTTVEAIEKVMGPVEIKTNKSSDPTAPGMMKSHYSPGKKLILGNPGENIKKSKHDQIGVITYDAVIDGVPEKNQFVLSKEGSIEEAARNIFRALRWMDRPDIKTIYADLLPDEGLGRAINDRLRRAAV